MCHKKHIKDIVKELFDYVQEEVYQRYNWNVTYWLFLQGYSSALIEYKFTDPTVPHSKYYRGILKDSQPYELCILRDIDDFVFQC